MKPGLLDPSPVLESLQVEKGLSMPRQLSSNLLEPPSSGKGLLCHSQRSAVPHTWEDSSACLYYLYCL
jgi:hypothetical protein